MQDPSQDSLVRLLRGQQRRASPAASDGLQGLLQADAYAGFDKLYASGAITLIACWAQARRKFHELRQDRGSPLAAEALRQIAALYATEEGI